MKYMVLLCDGMADTKNAELNFKTPMECADKPCMDSLARVSELGMCKTVADGLKPGSDVANLSVLGYDPLISYTGRSPLEAASIGIDLKDTDVTLRLNLVTLSDEENYEDKKMVDYCADDISTAEAAEIIKTIENTFGNDKYRFYSGVSYRHCLVVANGTTDLGEMTPPHDISGRIIGGYLSKSKNAKELIALMKKSYDLLKDHPINIKRIKAGRRPANSIWLWGEGTKPTVRNFKEKNGVSGCIISAVDLLKGIGKCADMDTPEVKGATGYIDTNFKGKAEACIAAFKGGTDLVYVHLEAPDECGHRGEAENKVKSIELIDSEVLKPCLQYLKGCGEDFRILIMPDHPTPLDIKTHSANPVPYLLYASNEQKDGADTFTENTAENSGIFIPHGPDMMKKLLK